MVHWILNLRIWLPKFLIVDSMIGYLKVPLYKTSFAKSTLNLNVKKLYKPLNVYKDLLTILQLLNYANHKIMK